MTWAAAVGSRPGSDSARRYAITPRTESGSTPTRSRMTRSRVRTRSRITPWTALRSPSGKYLGSSLRQRCSARRNVSAVVAPPAMNVLPKMNRIARSVVKAPIMSGRITPNSRPASAQAQKTMPASAYGSNSARRRASVEVGQRPSAGSRTRDHRSAEIETSPARTANPTRKNTTAPARSPGCVGASWSTKVKYVNDTMAPIRLAGTSTAICSQAVQRRSPARITRESTEEDLPQA